MALVRRLSSDGIVIRIGQIMRYGASESFARRSHSSRNRKLVNKKERCRSFLLKKFSLRLQPTA
jgi:hypothetical protein